MPRSYQNTLKHRIKRYVLEHKEVSIREVLGVFGRYISTTIAVGRARKRLIRRGRKVSEDLYHLARLGRREAINDHLVDLYRDRVIARIRKGVYGPLPTIHLYESPCNQKIG